MVYLAGMLRCTYCPSVYTDVTDRHFAIKTMVPYPLTDAKLSVGFLNQISHFLIRILCCPDIFSVNFLNNVQFSKNLAVLVGHIPPSEPRIEVRNRCLRHLHFQDFQNREHVVPFSNSGMFHKTVLVCTSGQIRTDWAIKQRFYRPSQLTIVGALAIKK